MAALLPIRPAPETDESLVGFLVRLAEAHQIESPLWMARRIGLSLSTLHTAATTSVSLEPLSNATGITIERLEAMSCRPDPDGKAVVWGHHFDRKFVSVHIRKACPLCLTEQPYHRISWDLTLVTVCTRHGCRLLKTCHDCGRPLDWTRVPLHLCTCGVDLRQARTASAGNAAIAATHEVLRLVGLPSSAGVEPLPDKVTAIGVAGVMSLLLHLGWFGSGGQGRIRPIQAVRDGREDGAWLGQGYETSLGWPDSLHTYLDRLRRGAAGRGGRYGVRRELGGLADWLGQTIYPDAGRDLVQGVVTDYFAARAELPTRSPRVRAVRTTPMFTLSEAARLLRRSSVRVRTIFQTHGAIGGAAPRGKGAPVLLDPKFVRGIQAELDGLVDREGLEDIVGLPTWAASLMLRIEKTPRASGLAADLFGRPCWHRSDLHSFVSSCEAKATAGSVGGISLPSALRILLDAGADERSAFDALADGTFESRLADDGGQGLGRLRFTRQHLLTSARARAGQVQSMSIPEVAVALGIKQQVVYQLCNASLLATIDPSAPGKLGRRITNAAIAEFRRDFVLASSIGDQSGRSRGWMAARLRTEGIQPVSGPSIDGGRQYVFRRSDIGPR